MTTTPTDTLDPPRAGTGTALHLDQISKIYRMGDTDIVALDRIDLTVGTGEIVALLGPSGSGKTTLCSIAGGILAPTSGRITVGREEITNLSARDLTAFRRDNIGFVFQSVNLVPFLTARENLLVVDEMGVRARAAARQRADQLLDELGLSDRAANLPSQLSGGQRHRVAIGRALMNEPTLVLFDEPTSALDTNLGLQVMDLIRTEMRQRGTTAIIVTHDLRATRFADRTVHITDGRLSSAGDDEPIPS